MITLTDIHRTYHKGTDTVRALDGVSLTIGRGDFVAITGASGSGKSTLMHILGLLDRPDAGSYHFDGQEVSSLDGEALARLRNERIGFVFQAFHLLPNTTALENVELPLIYSDRPWPRGRGLEALTRVGLSDRATHRPSELSGGQQQRVAIARALVQQPDLLLADEPTGNLDSKASTDIMDLFAELHAAGTTVVLITHDTNVASRAARRIVIADGRIVADRQEAA